MQNALVQIQFICGGQQLIKMSTPFSCFLFIYFYLDKFATNKHHGMKCILASNRAISRLSVHSIGVILVISRSQFHYFYKMSDLIQLRLGLCSSVPPHYDAKASQVHE